MTNLHIIEHHPRRVLEAFRRGEFDQIEIVGEADERDFFERCFKKKLLERLAGPMPTAREKEEVPRWFILAGNLSLKLHQENSFLAFERVVRAGGLLSALDPAIASKHLDKGSKQILLQCLGFNHKNHYDRTTPCDQDTLRKFVKDVPGDQWLEWFNAPVQQVFQQEGFFDPEGIFIGDATYLFVPDNPAYEGSVVMWFDQHNHPVDYEQLTPQQRKNVHRERCYKLVSLLHLRGPCWVYAALKVVPGNAHECPILYELVKNFVATVGPGVMKLLILDRGFIDGKNISRCKSELAVDVLIPIKKKMDLWTDAWDLGQTQPWVTLASPAPALPTAPPRRPEPIVRREQKRQRTLAARKAAQPAPPAAEVLVRTEGCALKDFNSWTEVSVPLHVLLLRDHFADGHLSQWALLSTRNYGQAGQPRDDYRLRTDIEERHRLLKCFYDLTDFRSRDFNVVVAQAVFVLLSYTLRQWQLWQRAQEALAGRTPILQRQALNLQKEYVVIYHQSAYTQMPLVSFTRELLELEGFARTKALAKVRQLEQSLLIPMENLRPP